MEFVKIENGLVKETIKVADEVPPQKIKSAFPVNIIYTHDVNITCNNERVKWKVKGEKLLIQPAGSWVEVPDVSSEKLMNFKPVEDLKKEGILPSRGAYQIQRKTEFGRVIMDGDAAYNVDIRVLIAPKEFEYSLVENPAYKKYVSALKRVKREGFIKQ